jgi:hypothetical protein
MFSAWNLHIFEMFSEVIPLSEEKEIIYVNCGILQKLCMTGVCLDSYALTVHLIIKFDVH